MIALPRFAALPSRGVPIAAAWAALAVALLIVDAVVPGESLALHGATLTSFCIFVLTCIRQARRDDDSQDTDREALRQELDAAECASAAKSRYLASVSHEIRSPLNAIYGYAQLVEREGTVDPRDAARVIRRSAEHLTNLVEGLLDIASIEQGVVRIDSTVARLDALVEQVAEMFRPLAVQKGLAFRCDLPARLPEFVRMDERRVRQVLINLVSNAVKFTQAGEVVLAVRWSGEIATFEVRDTGPGISPAHQETVFSPYQTGGVECGGGAGLGLAITRAIVDMLGGDLRLESRLGEGSLFRVVLMMPHVSGMVDCAAPRPRPVGYRGARRSLLLVDDDADHLAVLRCTLESCGFDVSLAPDGAAALALAHVRAFDAVVLDIAMPGLSGWEVAERLRAAHGQSFRLVMLSANAEERHGRRGKEPDHDLFLMKPVELSALVDALGKLLGLEWILSEGGGDTVLAQPRIDVSDSARGHVDRLKSLARIGHLRGLEAEIRSMQETDAGTAPLAARLFDCLDRCDLMAMRRVLEGI